MAKRSRLFPAILLGLAAVLGFHACQGIWVVATVPGHIAGLRTETVPKPPVKGRYGPLVSPVQNQSVSWITYSYEVQGTEYTHETLASERPAGDTFQVYYDANHPSRSSLHRPERPIFSAGFAVLNLVLFAILAVQGRSR